LLGVIYPLIVQLAWGSNGYMSSNLDSDDNKDYYADCGVLDFAGSGVVHVTGGLMALIGCILIGPRDGFKENEIKSNPYGPVFQTIGTLVVWFGWFGLTAGSTQGIVNMAQVASRSMVATAVSASCSCLVSFGLGYASDFIATKNTEVNDMSYVNNGALAGLVAISAGCSVVEMYGAAIIGCGSAIVYFASSKMLKKCGVDDVVDAVPIHFFCGVFGVLMASLLATKAYYKDVYGIYEDSEDNCAGYFYGGKINQLEANGSFLVVVIVFTGFLSTLVFGSLRCLGLLRVGAEDEESEI
jgi:Amt family ammonium transporter